MSLYHKRHIIVTYYVSFVKLFLCGELGSWLADSTLSPELMLTIRRATRNVKWEWLEPAFVGREFLQKLLLFT